MPGPGIDIRLFDLTVYAPQISDAIVGCVGPATKGPTNQLIDMTDEGNFVSTFGRPADNMYSQRACLRYFRRGNQLKYARIAGRNLATARIMLLDATGRQDILLVEAITAGSWANLAQLELAVTHNGTPATSYNLFVYFLGQLVESFLVMDNGIVVSRVNNGSTRIRVTLQPGAGVTVPAATIDPLTGEVARLSFTGGDDGAFAKTDSEFSSTGGFAGDRFHGKMDSVGGSRIFENILTITGPLASKPIIYGTVGHAVVPGTFSIRVQTAVGPGFVELADNGNLTYGSGGAGLGLLSPSAGAHVGFIDYRTGNWGVKLIGGATTFLNGTVDGIWIRANTESVGATAAGVASYAGTLGSGPAGVGFYNANKFMLSVPIDEVIGTDAAGGAASSNATAGLKALAGWIIPGTVVLSVSHATLPVPNPVYDDGFGGFRTQPNGGGSALTGAINYRTGVWSVTWDPLGSPVPAGGSLAAEYAIQIIDMGGGPVPGPTGLWVANETVQPSDAGGDGSAASTDPGASPIVGPIKRNTVHIDISATSAGPFRAYDNGVGGWLTRPRGAPDAVAVVGAIDYDTGAWSITIPAGTITATANIQVSYASALEEQARRTLRGTGAELLAAGTPLLAGGNPVGVVYDDPATANEFNGSTFLDHVTGEFALKLNLLPLGAGIQSFDVQDNGTLTAVYAPASILGFGDGTQTAFVGDLEPAPFRRNANRLLGFQGAQASIAGAGEPQVTFATLGLTDQDDHWTQNVVVPSDPDNFLNYRTGLAGIQWTGAPLADEAVFVIAEETVLDAVAKYPGDIGNEREVLTDGFYVLLGADPTVAGTFRLQVLFNSVVQESFGQAETIQELVDKVNDEVNGSRLVTVVARDAALYIPPDVAADQTSGLSGAFTMADVIGAKVGQVYTGLQLFANDEVVPVNWLMIPGQWHRQIITALQSLCEKKGRRAMAVVPAPDSLDPFEHRDFFNGHFKATSPGGPAVPTVIVPFPPQAEINSSQLATIVPWVTYFDQYSAKDVTEPADGEMANLIANTPAPWFPVAGLRRGRVLVDALRYSASREDRDLLYGPVGLTTEVVNPIIRKEGRGLVLYGQRTTQRQPSKLDRINVRWTVNVIMNILDLVSQDFIFELNDPILWREMSQALNQTLKPIVARRGLQDAFVLVDGTTTTPDDIDRLTVRAKLFIKPQSAAEFIEYDLILTPSGADFADIVVAG
jgi:hypothetical protein